MLRLDAFDARLVSFLGRRSYSVRCPLARIFRVSLQTSIVSRGPASPQEAVDRCRCTKELACTRSRHLARTLLSVGRVIALQRRMPKVQAVSFYGVTSPLSSATRMMACQGRSLAPKKRSGRPPKFYEGASRLLEANTRERPTSTVSERRRFLKDLTGKGSVPGLNDENGVLG